MTVESSYELERVCRVARRIFFHALMSDTKWRKLFTVLESGAPELCQMQIKFIEVAQPRTMMLPTISGEHVPWPYFDTIEFGPVEFRAIEWLDIPAVARFVRPDNLPMREVRQDLAQLEACLAASGAYPIQKSGDGIRIVGYLR